jgi:hypothetical protein
MEKSDFLLDAPPLLLPDTGFTIIPLLIILLSRPQSALGPRINSRPAIIIIISTNILDRCSPITFLPSAHFTLPSHCFLSPIFYWIFFDFLTPSYALRVTLTQLYTRSTTIFSTQLAKDLPILQASQVDIHIDRARKSVVVNTITGGVER